MKLHALAGLALILGCGGGGGPPKPAEPVAAAPAPASDGKPWRTPEGWKSETIPFPLDFAPSVAHRGNEELRFAPGFFDPAAPGYWSYAFAWRTDDAAAMDAAALGAALTAYFRGLIDAVDERHEIAGKDQIVARAAADGGRFKLEAHVFDAFKTKAALELTGVAERRACGAGALWVFVLAPATSGIRAELEALAQEAACGQPVLPPPPPKD